MQNFEIVRCSIFSGKVNLYPSKILPKIAEITFLRPFFIAVLAVVWTANDPLPSSIEAAPLAENGERCISRESKR